MTNENQLWTLERGFWLDGAEAFASHMLPDCVMIFPDPAGMLIGGIIVEGLKGMPRWARVDMTDKVLYTPAKGTACLAYRAEAQREDEPPYNALCASTYVETEDGWRIALHQHTPV